MYTDSNTFLGPGLVLLATVCNGTFALPPKFVRNWAWENTWGAFFLLTLLVVPTAVVFTTVQGTVEMWRTAPPWASSMRSALAFSGAAELSASESA